MKVAACPSRSGRPKPVRREPAGSQEWTVLTLGRDALELDPSIFHVQPAPPDLREALTRFPSQKLALVVGPEAGNVAQLLASSPRPFDLVVFENHSQRLDRAYELNATAVLASQDPKASALPLHALAGRDALQAARAYVREYAAQHTSGMQSAVHVPALQPLAHNLQALVQHLKTCPRDLVYSTMLATPPMAKDPDKPLHDERDLGTFLQAILSDERFPEAVQEHAIKTRRSYEDAIVSQWSSGDKKALRYGTGASVVLPWRHAADNSPFARDAGWGELLDHVFAESQPTSAMPLGSPFAEYKRYISPFQEVRCAYTPSCSAFMRDSVAQHGLWSGAQIGMLRFMGCDGTHSCSAQCACPKAGDVLVQPSGAGPATFTDQLLVRSARAAGQLLGATAGSLLGSLAGLAVGAWVGYQGPAYQPASATDEPTQRGYQRLTEALQPTGGLLGATTSAARGAAAGLLGGAALGAHFGGLWAQNRSKELLGQLAPRPPA